jgi:hypothetical protein
MQSRIILEEQQRSKKQLWTGTRPLRTFVQEPKDLASRRWYLRMLLFSEFLEHAVEIGKALDRYNNSDQGEGGSGDDEPRLPEMDEGHIFSLVSKSSFEMNSGPAFGTLLKLGFLSQIQPADDEPDFPFSAGPF